MVFGVQSDSAFPWLIHNETPCILRGVFNLAMGDFMNQSSQFQDRMTAEFFALAFVIAGLMRTHPNKNILRAEIEREFSEQQVRNSATGAFMSDQIKESLNRYLSLLG